MNCKISSLHFSPIKSLSFQTIKSCLVKKNVGIEDDRVYAFSRNLNNSEAILIEKDPNKRELINFLTLKNSPFLNRYSFNLDNENITIIKDGNEIISIPKNDREALSKKLLELEPKIPKPIYLLKNHLYPFFDTTHSEKTSNTISLINLNSIKDFEFKINKTIEFERFRGNIYVKNLKAWIERSWIGKIIKINNVELQVSSNIPRCSATNLKINSEISDINLPIQLKKAYGHMDMGIYLIPLQDGQLSIGDNIELV